jgi:hypothetical protein
MALLRQKIKDLTKATIVVFLDAHEEAGTCVFTESFIEKSAFAKAY